MTQFIIFKALSPQCGMADILTLRSVDRESGQTKDLKNNIVILQSTQHYLSRVQIGLYCRYDIVF